MVPCRPPAWQHCLCECELAPFLVAHNEDPLMCACPPCTHNGSAGAMHLFEQQLFMPAYCMFLCRPGAPSYAQWLPARGTARRKITTQANRAPTGCYALHVMWAHVNSKVCLLCRNVQGIEYCGPLSSSCRFAKQKQGLMLLFRKAWFQADYHTRPSCCARLTCPSLCDPFHPYGKAESFASFDKKIKPAWDTGLI
jgi:hypothetical protein